MVFKLDQKQSFASRDFANNTLRYIDPHQNYSRLEKELKGFLTCF